MARKKGSTGATTKPRIRAAAARLFAQAGYGAVTMRAIGAEAGVQAGALYRYFPDKESLAAELLETALATRDAALAGAAGGPPDDAFGRFVTAYLDWRIGNPGDAAMIGLLAAALGSDPQAPLEARLEALLESAEERGTARLPDTRAGAGAILAAIDRVAGDERLSRDRRLRIGLRFAERIAGV